MLTGPASMERCWLVWHLVSLMSRESITVHLLIVRRSHDIVYSTYSSAPGTSKALWSYLLGYHLVLECHVAVGDIVNHRQNHLCRTDVYHLPALRHRSKRVLFCSPGAVA